RREKAGPPTPRAARTRSPCPPTPTWVQATGPRSRRRRGRRAELGFEAAAEIGHQVGDERGRREAVELAELRERGLGAADPVERDGEERMRVGVARVRRRDVD